MTGRITLAGEWHPTEDMATNDNAAKVVALNGNMPILKPIARSMFRADQSATGGGGAFRTSRLQFDLTAVLLRNRQLMTAHGKPRLDVSNSPLLRYDRAAEDP